MTDEFFKKESYTIKDLASIVKKETNTIRSWEHKNIISKPGKSSNNWRQYSKEELADTLETVLNFDWDRKVIKNKAEIQYAIDRLRGKEVVANINIMGERDE